MICLVKVKKRKGTTEEFVESKIAEGVKRAGATAEEASQVAKEIAEKVAHKAQVKAQELSEMVVTSLRKVNKAAANEFVRFRDEKLKAQKKKVKAKRKKAKK